MAGHVRATQASHLGCPTPGPTVRLPILLLGHSFVKRLTAFALQRGCHNMALHTNNEVFFHGIGGLSFPGLSAEIDMVRSLGPKVVFIDIGSNDLSGGADPAALAHSVFNFAKHLTTHQGVSVVIVSQVFFRNAKQCRYPTPADFNDRVTVYNMTLAGLSKEHQQILFWKHKGIWYNWPSYLVDGVHFTQEGLRKYYNSVRGALVAGVKRHVKLSQQ